MSNIIDFAIERAYRKSGIKDRSLIEDILTQGYNPCNPDDVTQYYKWSGFISAVLNVDTPESEYWTEESLSRIWSDMQDIDNNQTYTVSYDFDSTWTDDELNFDFEYDFDTVDKDE